MQPLAGVAHELGESGLDVEVHVLELELPFEAARFDVVGDLRQAALDGRQVVGADDSLRRQHLRVGQRACDVGPPEAPVEGDAGGVALHQLAHGLGEKRRPRL